MDEEDDEDEFGFDDQDDSAAYEENADTDDFFGADDL